jgi:intracellular sulfur oxidation DsrE/DsrF family protein
VSQEPSSTPRRRFIANLVGGTAALAAGAAFPHDLGGQQGGGFPSYPPPQGGWDLAWADRIAKAKHRVVFDSPEVADGLVFTNAQTYYAGYKDVYNAPDTDLGVVVVIRHRAIQMVLNDALWERWKIGEQLSVKDPQTNEPALRNIWAKGGARGGGGSMEGLMQRGVVILACNLALMRSAGQFASAMNVPVEEARKLFIDALVPGVIRQTSGIFAVTRAQEAGANFVKSS